jgi:hypothetical protein
MQDHTHRDYSHHWYIKTRLQFGHIFRRDMQNHTQTYYSHHWYIRTRLQCGHIFMSRYAKSHTHIDLDRRSILLAGSARGHRTSSIFVDGLESWFLACNESTKLPSLTYTFGMPEHSTSGRRKHRKKWSLDTGWRIVHPENNDHWTQDEIVVANMASYAICSEFDFGDSWQHDHWD